MYAAYLRVSTQKQGDSGLGLEAQRKCIRDRVGDPIAWFRDIASGTSLIRNGLDEALSFCKKHSATLVVSTPDRLSRSFDDALVLLASGVPIISADEEDILS